MSGDSPATIENIWRCPFCGREAVRIELIEQSKPDGYTYYEGGGKIQEIILRIECGDILADSPLRRCPAMSECGCYHLHIYPDGTCHAYYY